MGQYYLICNLDKREYLHPHRLGEGMKAREWLWSGQLPRALSVLLIDGDGRGGGDVNCSISGRWAGDRIVIAGDYGDQGKFTVGNASTDFIYKITEKTDGGQAETLDDVSLYRLVSEDYTDISKEVIDAISAIGDIDEWMKGWTYIPPRS